MKTRLLYLLGGFFVVMGLAATAGHYFAPRPTQEMLQQGFYPPGPEWFLEQIPRYDAHIWKTALHVVPAFAFVLLIVLQLSSRLRRKRPAVHRVIGRILFVFSVVMSLSGLVLGLTMPFGGIIESIAMVFYAGVFLFCLFRGIIYIRQKNIQAHRYWMLHMVALAFAPVTMRMLLGFAMYLSNMSGPEIFGPLMIVSPLVNVALLRLFVLKKTSAKNLDVSLQYSQR